MTGQGWRPIAIMTCVIAGKRMPKSWKILSNWGMMKNTSTPKSTQPKAITTVG